MMISLVLQIVSLRAHSDFAECASILHQKQPFPAAHFADSPSLLHGLKSTSLANPEFFDSGIVRNNAVEGKEFTFLEMLLNRKCIIVGSLFVLFIFCFVLANIRGLKSFLRPVDKWLAETLKDGQKKNLQNSRPQQVKLNCRL